MADEQTAAASEPSPDRFPGMDPYLENPDHWQGFHNGLITYLREGINRVLPRGYIAFIEQRLVILPEDQLRRADLALIRHPVPDRASSSGEQNDLQRGRPDGILSSLPDEVYDWFVEIRTSRDT